jgi:hypothetical protein
MNIIRKLNILGQDFGVHDVDAKLNKVIEE